MNRFWQGFEKRAFGVQDYGYDKGRDRYYSQVYESRPEREERTWIEPKNKKQEGAAHKSIVSTNKGRSDLYKKKHPIKSFFGGKSKYLQEVRK